jgi:DNA polymerase-3 subunit alpha
MATIRASEEDPTSRTAWSETPRLSIVDDFGFSKWDFLSITGMTQQDRIVNLIRDRTGQQYDLDLLPPCADPRDVDPKVMEVFHRGHTLGIWQFEGAGITAFLKQAKPMNVIDLAAVNAIYRPGPMGSGGHNRYAKRKNGDEPATIPPVLEPVLSDTFGSLCFQEQIMELFEVLAGYSAAQADDIRKEIDKLNRGRSDEGRIRLAARKEEFITKATALIGAEAAENLWLEIVPYTGYSFNRPHASGYSVQAYQDAWLKVYFPFEFYAVLLSLEPKKTPKAIRESRFFGIEIGPPDVNKSGIGYTVDYDEGLIRHGLIGVDGIGDVAAQQVVEKAPYDSLAHFDLSHSFKYSKVNKGHRLALLEAGALDSLGGRADWTESQRAQTEAKRLGMALRPGGTFGEYEDKIAEAVYSEEEVEAMMPGDAVVIAGKISNIRPLMVKRGRQAGRKMARVQVRFGIDQFECTFFPDTFVKYEGLIVQDQGLMVRGKRDAQGQIIVNAVMAVEEWIAETRDQVAA